MTGSGGNPYLQLGNLLQLECSTDACEHMHLDTSSIDVKRGCAS